MRWLAIPAAALLVWPVYAWASRMSAPRRVVRVVLGAVFGLTVLVEGCVGANVCRARASDHARYDDGLYALVLYGGGLFALSIVLVLLGELVLWLERMLGRRSGGERT